MMHLPPSPTFPSAVHGYPTPNSCHIWRRFSMFCTNSIHHHQEDHAKARRHDVQTTPVNISVALLEARTPLFTVPPTQKSPSLGTQHHPCYLFAQNPITPVNARISTNFPAGRRSDKTKETTKIAKFPILASLFLACAS